MQILQHIYTGLALLILASTAMVRELLSHLETGLTINPMYRHVKKGDRDAEAHMVPAVAMLCRVRAAAAQDPFKLFSITMHGGAEGLVDYYDTFDGRVDAQMMSKLYLTICHYKTTI